MGYYVNPKDQDKDSWLEANGMQTGLPPERFDAWNDHLIVCLVDNIAFTAAGIAYDQRELNRFLRPDSGPQRPRKWFLVPIVKLLAVSDLWKNLAYSSYESANDIDKE